MGKDPQGKGHEVFNLGKKEKMRSHIQKDGARG